MSRRTTVIFGTLKDVRLLINSVASNETFVNDANTLSNINNPS